MSLNLVGFGTASADLTTIAALRKRLPAWAPKDTPGHFLKHADEQTVVAVAALDQAIAEGSLEAGGYREWSIIAAPRFIGRLAGVTTLDRFGKGGGPAISPHVIPQHSLHSISGALSILLASRRPNIGIGGTSNSVAEALLSALTAPVDRGAGVWLVATAWDPEPIVNQAADCLNSPVCYAAALALRSSAVQQDFGSLRLTTGTPPVSCPPQLPALVETLEALSAERSSAHLAWPLLWGMTIELEVSQPAVHLAKAA